ncbi:MAG: hypothetical protein QGF78_03315 [Candidatus Bathyarchaeota archaeon]|jgi:hypothetical protein|nr:hypothetical protein [Candidatus Bathyarchaeota archaeon]
MSDPMKIDGDTMIEKLGGLHWFWVGAVILVLIFIPLLIPLNLPISTTEWTHDAVDAIQDVPSNKIVVWEDNWGMGALAEAEVGHVALMRILLKNNVKFVMVALGEDTPLLHAYISDLVAKSPEAVGKTYGKDWAQMGFLPGGEGALSLMAEDFHATFGKDFDGTSLSSLPIMNNLHDSNDIGLVITGSPSQTWVEAPVRQWYTKYNIPLVSYTLTGGTVLSGTYYPNNGILGIIEGSTGGAELEYIGKVPGNGARISDAKTLAYLATAAFIVIGNISYFGSKKNKGGTS